MQLLADRQKSDSLYDYHIVASCASSGSGASREGIGPSKVV